jgi:hypothetical protein
MKIPELETINVENLEVVSDTFHLRRDLHTYVDYIRGHEVKRTVRENTLPKGDARRLAKLLSHPATSEEPGNNAGAAGWVDGVDWLAFKLGFTTYDTKGVYLGYTSSQESFPDNYIRFEKEAYQQFQSLPLQQQEQKLLNTMVDHWDNRDNEFFSSCGFSGRLDSFYMRGCATGVIPLLKFGDARRALLDILAQCRGGLWYSTASLTQYLKNDRPFFLIPEKPKYKYSFEKKDGRYQNFYEGKDPYDRETSISANDPNAFERVEGRYVERFLEGIPLTLGYVQIAYGPEDTPGIFPSIGKLKAFRVDDRFIRLMKGQIGEPRVTVQPNFEIHVEADFYPAKILGELAAVTDGISSGRVCILKLNKRKAVAELAERGNLDLSAFLTRISQNPLPQNIATEIAEWAGHSETFTLFAGFGLLESGSPLPLADPFTVERISSSLRIVRSPEALFIKLEEAKLAPLQVSHRGNSFTRLFPGVESVFAPEKPTAPKAKKREPVTLLRNTTVTLHFPTKRLMETCVNALVKERCPIETNAGALTITFAAGIQAKIQKALDSIEAFRIKIKEAAS